MSQNTTVKKEPASMVMITLLIFILLLLWTLSIWQFNRGFEKQEVSKQFDSQQNQDIKSLTEFNDFNNLDAPPAIFTAIKIKGTYGQSPQDIIWIERFTEFKANDQPNQEVRPIGTATDAKNEMPAPKKPHYFLLQKLYIERNTNNIRPIWVWRGISEQVLSMQDLQKMPTAIEKVMRAIPRIPQIFTLGDNCYPFNPQIGPESII
jgi:hypothetical protein